MSAKNKASNNKKFVCLCNFVTKDEIETAIKNGCDSLGKIFDRTSAGVGPCGGSCQPYIKSMLETYRATGKFPEDPRPTLRKRRR